MKMPSDISEDFQGSWEAFLELPQTSKLEPLVLGECFRILLAQAGIKTQTKKSLTDFLTVNNRYKSFSKTVHAKFLLYNLLPVKHTYELESNENALINVINGFTLRGVVKLKPQRYELDYILKRLVELKVFKQLPEALQLSSRVKMVNGEKKTVYADRFPTAVRKIRSYDEVPIVGNSEMQIKIARLKGDFLVLKYELYFDTVLPMYPNLEKQLFAVWRRATIGDFR